MPDSLTTFGVYVDGELKDEVVDLPAGEVYLFVVDIVGVKTLRLVTAAGSYNIFGDAVIWANAKLGPYIEDCTEHSWGNGAVLKVTSGICTADIADDGETVIITGAEGQIDIEALY